MLHKDAFMNPVLPQNRGRVFSVEKAHSPEYEFTEYYQNMKFSPSPHRAVSVNRFIERPTTVKMNKASKFKES